jgi:uncharacterized protein YndB with AHSA1/START domain
MINRETLFSKDLPGKKLQVTRTFDAPLDLVWRAWTEREILDQWWAPKPYRAETKTMDFREGGLWLYAMVGPQGDRSWCRVDYQLIEPQVRIVSTDGFCDEEGNPSADFSPMHWHKTFSSNNDETTVQVNLSFDKEDDLQTILQMGFQEGFTAGLSNLDAYLSTHFRLRK